MPGADNKVMPIIDGLLYLYAGMATSNKSIFGPPTDQCSGINELPWNGDGTVSII